MDDALHGIELDALQAMEGEAPLDELFAALSDRQTRFALYYLADKRSATFERLTDAVTGFEARADETLATPADRERVRSRLYHVVLPRLDAEGLVEFDADELTVRTEPSRDVAALLGLEG